MTRRYRKSYRSYSRRSSMEEAAILWLFAAGAGATLIGIVFAAVKNAFIANTALFILVVILTISALVGAVLLVLKMKRRRAEKWLLSQRTKRDFLAMDPFEFEHFVGKVFQKLGYSYRVTQARGDHGIDVELKKNGKRFAVQVKQYGIAHTVGEPELRDFYGSFVNDFDAGFFVTTSSFTPPALEWRSKNPLVELWNGDKLVEVVNSFRESSDRELLFGSRD